LLFFLIVVVSCAVLVTHWPALSAKVISFDDHQYLTENALVQNPSFESAWLFLSQVLEPSTVGGYYQPLAMISLMLDYALGGSENNLMPFHRTSLILHTANTALIIVLLYLLFENVWAAAAAGLLFGVHPMTVEPIPWVGERKTLLAAFFALWCLILYVRYAQKGGRKFYISCMVMYVLALMSKPTSTPLPLVMLLIDYWPLRRAGSKSKIIFEKFPLFAIGALSAVVTYISQSRTAATSLPGDYRPEYGLLVLCHNIIFYLYKMLWPMNLSSHYAFPKLIGLANPMMLAGVIGTCVLIPLLIISLRWTRAAFTGWLIFFVAILPTMQVIGFSNVIASDKFAYLPSIGLLMALTAFLIWLYKKCGFSKLCMTAAIMIVPLLSVSEAVGTRRYLANWKDTISYCRYMLTLTPSAASLYNLMGIAFQADGRPDDAIGCFYRAVRLNPNEVETYNNLASVLIDQNKIDDAIECYEMALRIKLDGVVYYNLGVALAKKNKLDEAEKCYEKAVKIKPYFPRAYNNLGNIFLLKGRFDEAEMCFQKALQIWPNYPQAWYNLGNTFKSQARLNDALDCYNKALWYKPDDAEIHNNLGITLALIGQPDDAVAHLRRALQLKPDYVEAHYNLGIVLASQGKLDEAITCYQQALRFKSNDIDVLKLLAQAYAQTGRFDNAVTTAQSALRLLSADKNAELVDYLQKKIESYKQQKP
jgi:tetratricopeptide (TPR) repeat protein